MDPTDRPEPASLRLEPSCAGWRVIVDDGAQPPREFTDLDAALRWSVARHPAAIRLPDDLFVPTEQGPGLDLAAAHLPAAEPRG